MTLEEELVKLLKQPTLDNSWARVGDIRRRLVQMKRDEESYWALRARVERLKIGDSNSKFFSAIDGLWDSNGVLRKDEVGMSEVVLDYFSALLKVRGLKI